MGEEIRIPIDLGEIDVSQLETEEGRREAAWAIMPKVLRKIGEEAGAAAWDSMQVAFNVPGFEVNRSSYDRQRFIESAGQEFCDNKLGDKEIEDQIVRRLEEIKDGVDAE